MPSSSHFDPTFSTALQWEIDWIMSHPEGYDGPMHQKAVCGNVIKRYKATALNKLVNNYAESRTTGDQVSLFEHIGAEI